MDQVEVEILGQVITAQYGTLSTGQILRTSAAFAKHLVDDCAAAKYRTPVAAEGAAPKPPAKAKPAKAGSTKAGEAEPKPPAPDATKADGAETQTPPPNDAVGGNEGVQTSAQESSAAE